MYCIKLSKKHRILFFFFFSNIPWKISFMLWVFVIFFPFFLNIFLFSYLFHFNWNRSYNNLVEHCNTVKQRLLSIFRVDIGLAKKFISVFPLDVVGKPEWNFGQSSALIIDNWNLLSECIQSNKVEIWSKASMWDQSNLYYPRVFMETLILPSGF